MPSYVLYVYDRPDISCINAAIISKYLRPSGQAAIELTRPVRKGPLVAVHLQL